MQVDLSSYRELLLDIGPSNISIDNVVKLICDDYTHSVVRIFVQLEEWRDTLWNSILENIRLHLTNTNEFEKQENIYKDGLKSNQHIWIEYEKTVELIKRILPYIGENDDDNYAIPYSMNVKSEEYDEDGNVCIKYIDSSSDDYNDITTETTIDINNDKYCNPEYVSLRNNSCIPMSQKLIYQRRSRLETIGRQYFSANESENIQVLCEEDRNPINVKAFANCKDKNYGINDYLFGQMNLSCYDRYYAIFSIKSYKRVDSKKNIVWLENVRILMKGNIPLYVNKDWKPPQNFGNVELKLPVFTNVLTMRRKAFVNKFEQRVYFIDKKIGITKYITKKSSLFIRRKINHNEIASFPEIDITNYKSKRYEFCEFVHIYRFYMSNYLQDFMPCGFRKKEVSVMQSGGLPFIGSWQLSPEPNMEYSRIYSGMPERVPYCVYGENAKFIRNAFISAAYDGNVKVCGFIQQINNTIVKKLQAWKLFRFKGDKYMVVFGDLR